MRKKYLTAAALLGSVMMSYPAFAQSNAGVDPACILKNSDGSETVDMTKCPDGKTVGGAATAPAPAPAPDANTATTPAPDANTATTPSNENTNSNTAQQPATTTAPATDAAGVIVPADSFAGAKVMTASDFIGKRVYTKAGEDIGEVNDLIVTDNGGVQAVVLGVGGFLGIGEKDVAVRMAAIEMQQDGQAVKLIVDASKDQLTAAPAYDRAARTYTN